MSLERFRVPRLAAEEAEDGWREEILEYAVRPSDKPKFKSILSPNRIFGDGSSASSRVLTRARTGASSGEPCFELKVEHRLPAAVISESLSCIEDGGMSPAKLTRRVEVEGEVAREETIEFARGPLAPPVASYPEVLLPFLMRGQPRDEKRRAAHAWTNDRFIARVYYECRGVESIEVPAGRFQAKEVWMYPDLNDWVSLGSMLTRLAKPLLPRYVMYFELAPPERLLVFRGPYGPPGAPEITLELK